METRDYYSTEHAIRRGETCYLIDADPDSCDYGQVVGSCRVVMWCGPRSYLVQADSGAEFAINRSYDDGEFYSARGQFRVLSAEDCRDEFGASID